MLCTGTIFTDGTIFTEHFQLSIDKKNELIKFNINFKRNNINLIAKIFKDKLINTVEKKDRRVIRHFIIHKELINESQRI